MFIFSSLHYFVLVYALLIHFLFDHDVMKWQGSIILITLLVTSYLATKSIWPEMHELSLYIKLANICMTGTHTSLQKPHFLELQHH